MRKIKYQGGLTKLITSRIGKQNKVKFARFIDKNLCELRKKMEGKLIQIDVVSFSSGNDFYEQILSILSFLRYAGTPASWTIYSDGSHLESQVDLLNNGFEFIKIKMPGGINDNLIKQVLLPYKNELLDYTKKHHLGKKLFYYLNHPIDHPTLFMDSDILFYNKALEFD